MFYPKYFCVLLWTVQVLANVQLRTSRINQPWNVSSHIRQIGYSFSKNIDPPQRDLLEQSMREIEQAVNVEGHDTCISFRKRNRENHYVYIRDTDSGLCIEKDETATGSGRELLDLRIDCMNKRNITSSLLVLIGLFHEHQRPDRDQYIQVHMDNAQDDVRKSFKRLTSNNTNQFGFPYDFHSITHYGQYAYAKNTSLPTITSNVAGVGFGENTVLSYYDVRKVQMLYSCAKGYAMFRGQLNLFKQEAFDKFYPQWHNSSEDLPVYMKRDCYKNSTDIYTLTVLHGAKWTSKLPLPPGNFSISVDVCIATFSNAIKSFIEMKMGTDTSRFDHLKPSQRGQWENLNVTYTSLAEWNLVLKAHILWGEDVLAVDNLVVTPNV